MALLGYIMAKITYSTAHVHHRYSLGHRLCGLVYICMSFTLKALVAAALGLYLKGIMVMLDEVML